MDCNYVRYIPPVDTPCNATYAGCYRVSPPPTSTTQNHFGVINPRCPLTVCSTCSGNDCKCNQSHMRNPRARRYWVYKWNQY